MQAAQPHAGSTISCNGPRARTGRESGPDSAYRPEQGLQDVGSPPEPPGLSRREIPRRHRAKPQGIHRRPGRVRQAGQLRSAAGVGRADARRPAAPEADRVLPHRRPGRSRDRRLAEGRVHADLRPAGRRSAGGGRTQRRAISRADRAGWLPPAGDCFRGLLRPAALRVRKPSTRLSLQWTPDLQQLWGPCCHRIGR